MSNSLKTKVISLAVCGCIVLLSWFFFFRLDLTSDKRYSIAPQTKSLMQQATAKLHFTLYLDGELNPGFQRLKKSSIELIDELHVYAGQDIELQITNPAHAESADARERNFAQLTALGMKPTAIYERDKEGKAIQKIIFPWLQIDYNNKTVYVNLLKNIRGISGEENLNISIENLEFEITDGIRRAMRSVVEKIAFIEGHGELNEAETYDISKALSRYFQIDRGIIGTDAAVLDAYKAIIIAKPTQPFSEKDKFVIDQYLMRGGKIFWFLDGVRIASENLSKNGLSPAIALDLNLSDQLFKYGVRINADLLQDVQCAQMPVNIAPAQAEAQFEPAPWFFAPLLLTSFQHPITKNITEVRSEFASSISLVGDKKAVEATALLATSDNTHAINTPATINIATLPNPKDKQYFNQQYLPVAVLIEGQFTSNFEHRMLPDSLHNVAAIRDVSLPTRQLVVADGDIIRNETNGIASDSTTMSLGFDRYMNQQFGNKDFVQHAVLYLADDPRWLDLRSRTLKLRLLNKKIIADDKVFWQLTAVTIPLLILILFGLFYPWYRHRKYTTISKEH
ncbi:MAG: gliding motility-associated ABC transporter substrate-binding protein GldG [Porphyromonadaceae bacterium CG2_30_38_12]|nr:MAG: gliding motility-associated ABC transporter substrate-binding protein GldG [Porphyromonadaceae bacterium CG2_30_38_12]